jgi:hypothetical protein
MMSTKDESRGIIARLEAGEWSLREIMNVIPARAMRLREDHQALQALIRSIMNWTSSLRSSGKQGSVRTR